MWFLGDSKGFVHTIFPPSVEPRAMMKTSGLQPFLRSFELIPCRASRVAGAASARGAMQSREARYFILMEVVGDESTRLILDEE